MEQLSDSGHKPNYSLIEKNIYFHNSSETRAITDRLYTGTCLAIGIMGLLANVVILVFILKGINKKPHSKKYCICVAIGNVLYSTSAVLLFITRSEHISINQSVCSLYTFINHCGYYICTSSLILMALERICAIRFPLFFRKLTKRKHVMIQIILVFLSSISLGIFPVADSKIVVVTAHSTVIYTCTQSSGNILTYYYFIFDCLLPVVLFISLSFWAIFVLKKKSTISVMGQEARPRTNGASLTRSKRYLIFIVIMFILCFVPYFIYAIIDIAPGPELPAVVGNTVDVLTYSHTLINPIMYWVCDRTFRKRIKSIICGCRESKTEEPSQTQATINNAVSGNVNRTQT